jgi:CBS domain-containing protein
MHPGVLTCPPETSMGEVARMMAAHRVHSVVVSHPADQGKRAEWGIVSDMDLVAMLTAAGFEDRTAGDCPARARLTVSADASLAEAAQLMAEHQVAHLIALAPSSGRPVGIISTLDLARIAASPEA